MAYYASLENLKTYLEMKPSVVEFDTLLALFLGGVTSKLEGYINRELKAKQRVVYLRAGRRVYYLPAFPIIHDLVIGDATTVFTLTVTGTTVRYTAVGGTESNITATSLPIGTSITINSPNLSATNNGVFTITDAGVNWFEISNASGVAEALKPAGAPTPTTAAYSVPTRYPITVKYYDTVLTEGSDFWLWDESGKIEFSANASFPYVESLVATSPKAISISWTGGYPELHGVVQVPDEVQLACLQQTAHEFRRRIDAGASYNKMPNGELRYDKATELLPTVQAILDGYKRSPDMEP